jgi:hypothetical protein
MNIMKFGKAFIVGVVAGAALSLMLAIARSLGLPANLEVMQGSIVTGSVGPSAYALGLVMHLVISGLIAMFYAIVFEFGTRRAGVWIGLLLSIVHTLIAGVFMAIAPMIHPLIPSELSAPGAFMANLGAPGVILFIALHLVFGAIVGGLYGSVEQVGEQ